MATMVFDDAFSIGDTGIDLWLVLYVRKQSLDWTVYESVDW